MPAEGPGRPVPDGARSRRGAAGPAQRVVVDHPHRHPGRGPGGLHRPVDGHPEEGGGVLVYNLLPARAAHEAAREALATAEGLEGETADGLYVAGMVSYLEWSWGAAERALSRALEIDPDHVRALCWHGFVMVTVGRLEEARLGLERARHVDPLAPFPYGMSGFVLLAAGRPAEALPLVEQALAFERGNTLALWTAGLTEVALGRCDEGVAHLEEACTPSHRGGFIHGALGYALATAGRTGDAREVLEELRSRPAPAPTIVPEAWILHALGETEAAWKVLHRAMEERQPILGFARLPAFDPLRNDPRFAAMLSRLGLPAA